MKLRTLLVTSLVVWIGIGISWAQNFDQQIDEQRVKLRQNSQDIDALLNLARYLSWSGRLEEASRTYKQVLVIKPGQVEAEIGLAAVFYITGYSWLILAAAAMALFPDSLTLLHCIFPANKLLKKHMNTLQRFRSLIRVFLMMRYSGPSKIFACPFLPVARRSRRPYLCPTLSSVVAPS